MPILLALLGLLIGSFLNVVIHRLPRMIDHGEEEHGDRYDLLWPPSHCPRCGRPIRAWENVPLASWLALRGRCAGCRNSIPWRYPVVEAASAALPALLALAQPEPARACATAVLLWFLIPLTAIDLRERLLPDALTLPLLWTGLLAAVLTAPFATPPAAVIGAAVGYSSLRALSWTAERAMGRPALGLGDVKLFAALGAWFGWAALAPILFAAAALGTAVAFPALASGRLRHGVALPFGPFLAIAGLLVMLRPDWFRAFGFGGW